jgi:hypothetical protein
MPPVDVFYRWCQELSLAVFADVAALEVFMRSAMARELSWRSSQGIAGVVNLVDGRRAGALDDSGRRRA